MKHFTSPRLEARSLTIRRGRREVVKDVSFRLEPGVTVLLGPNGAGKTTLLEAIVGLLRPHQGKILVDAGGRDTEIGYMPQNWRGYGGFTVLEQVTYAAWLSGLSGPRARQSAISAIRQVDLSEHSDKRVRRLSGGQKQRVGLAESLCVGPAALLLDEPTVGLDPQQRQAFRKTLIRESADKAVLLSTHIVDDLSVLRPRVLIIRSGELIFDGSTDDLEKAGGNSSFVEPGTASQLESGYLSILEGVQS